MASSSKGLNNFQGFKKVLDQAKNIIVLSGAGISAESGIPVFRGLTGIWRNHKPTSLATPDAFTANPALVWEFYHYRRCVAFNAPPNNAHLALAKFEQDCKTQNKNFHIITQNVDGLHHRAGSKNVLELHGALSKIRCTHCEQVEENWENPICEALKDRGDPNVTEKSLPPIDIAELPKCKTCGKLARPHIVWFGENLDLNLFEQARNLMEACDLCLLVGTSSVVMPAAMFAPLVAERGYPVAEFNLNDASGQENFQFHFPGPCGTCLPKALGYED